MRKWMLAIVILLVAVGLIGYGAVRYVRPTHTLDLSHGKISVSEKVAEMLRNRRPTFILNEGDVNTLLKQKLSEQPNVADRVTVTGAEFTLHGDKLVADVNAEYDGRLPVGATITYGLEWRAPEVVAVCEEVRIRSLRVPPSWFSPGDVRFNLSQQMPNRIKAKDVKFGEEGIYVSIGL